MNEILHWAVRIVCSTMTVVAIHTVKSANEVVAKVGAS